MEQPLAVPVATLLARIGRVEQVLNNCSTLKGVIVVKVREFCC